MYTAKYLSPMIPSYDVEKTVSFFVDLLHFNIARDDKTYCILYKDDVRIHIQQAGRNVGEMSFYLEVDDIDKLWQDIKERSAELQLKAPFDRDYGMREIHIAVPQTKTLMFIGQQMS